MKFVYGLLAAISIMAFAAGAGLAQYAAPPGASPPSDDTYAQAIRSAPDASSAIDAYSSALSRARSPAALHEAFVHKMVDLGQPDLAYSQALLLTSLQPGNGFAWCVLAYDNADRGNVNDALTDIAKAAKLAPDDPFVIRTSGQLLAWFDSPRVDRRQVPNDIIAGMDNIRSRFNSNNTFATAYTEAYQAYTPSTAATTAQPPVAQQYTQPYWTGGYNQTGSPAYVTGATETGVNVLGINTPNVAPVGTVSTWDSYPYNNWYNWGFPEPVFVPEVVFVEQPFFSSFGFPFFGFPFFDDFFFFHHHHGFFDRDDFFHDRDRHDEFHHGDRSHHGDDFLVHRDFGRRDGRHDRGALNHGALTNNFSPANRLWNRNEARSSAVNRSTLAARGTRTNVPTARAMGTDRTRTGLAPSGTRMRSSTASPRFSTPTNRTVAPNRSVRPSRSVASPSRTFTPRSSVTTPGRTFTPRSSVSTPSRSVAPSRSFTAPRSSGSFRGSAVRSSPSSGGFRGSAVRSSGGFRGSGGAIHSGGRSFGGGRGGMGGGHGGHR